MWGIYNGSRSGCLITDRQTTVIIKLLWDNSKYPTCFENTTIVIVSNPNIIYQCFTTKDLKFYLFIDGTEIRNGHYTPIYGPTDGLLRIHSYIRYTEAVLEYTPGLWNVLKWAWIQYASILLIFYYVVGIFKNVVFGQQMIPTWNEKRIKTVSR